MTPIAFEHMLTEMLHAHAGPSPKQMADGLEILRHIAGGQLVNNRAEDTELEIARAAVSHGILKEDELCRRKGAGASGMLMHFSVTGLAYERFIRTAHVCPDGNVKIAH